MKQYQTTIRCFTIFFGITIVLLIACLCLLPFLIPIYSIVEFISLLGFYFFIGICLIFLIFTLLRLNKTFRINKQCYERQFTTTKEAINQAIETMTSSKHAYILYDQGIIIKQGMQYLILPFEEIIWVHPTTTSSYLGLGTTGVSMDVTLKENTLTIYSKRGIVGTCKGTRCDELYKHLQKQCPHAIFGYDKQYHKFYKKQRSEFIQLCKEYDYKSELLHNQ